MTLYTVGYEGRAAEALVAELAAEHVELLVDVRLNAISRKPGLSKRKLAEALAAAGIGYEHLPALGNPKENRDAFKAGDPASRDVLRDRLRSRESADAVGRVAALASSQRVALLCVEREIERCHRQVVAEEVLRVAPDLTVTHLC